MTIESQDKCVLHSLIIKNLFQRYNHTVKFNSGKKILIIHGLNGIGKTTIFNLINHLNNSELFEICKKSYSELIFNFSYPNSEKIKYWLKINQNKERNLIKIDLENGLSFSFDDEDIRNVFSKYRFKLILYWLQVYQNSVDNRSSKKLKSQTSIDDLAKHIFPKKYIENSEFLFELEKRMKCFECLYIPTQRVNFEENDWEKLVLNWENYFLLENKKNEIDGKKFFGSKVKIDLEYLRHGALTQGLVSRFLKLREIIDKRSDIINDIELFIKLINSYFYDKKVIFNETSKEKILFRNIVNKEEIPIEIDDLSSGETNLLIIFYDLIFSSSKDSIVLIDEPEISLHAQWQLDFVKSIIEIQEQKKNFVILSTHSPQILDDWGEMECLTIDEE